MNDATRELIKKKNIKRNKQLAYLMVKNPHFQKAIAYSRKKLGMPSDGFRDQKSHESYYRNKEKEYKNVRLSEKLSMQAMYLGKFGAYVKQEIHAALMSSRLMYSSEKFVTYYLLFNELPEKDSYFLSRPYCNDYPDEFSDKMIKLAIIIDDSTTIEEVKMIWPQVMEQQRLRKIYRPVNHTRAISDFPAGLVPQIHTYFREKDETKTRTQEIPLLPYPIPATIICL